MAKEYNRKTYIESKRKALLAHVNKLDEEKQEVARDLVENLAFQTCTLYELRQQIVETGFVEEYQNGANQFGTKQSASVATYNKMMTVYNQTSKQFVGLFEKDEKDGLDKDLGLGKFFDKAQAIKR